MQRIILAKVLNVKTGSHCAEDGISQPIRSKNHLSKALLPRLCSLWVTFSLNLFISITIIDVAVATEDEVSIDILGDIDEAAREHLILAREYIRRRDYLGAAEQIKAAHTLKAIPIYLYWLAKCFEQAKEFDKAMREYRKFIQKPAMGDAQHSGTREEREAAAEAIVRIRGLWSHVSPITVQAGINLVIKIDGPPTDNLEFAVVFRFNTQEKFQSRTLAKIPSSDSFAAVIPLDSKAHGVIEYYLKAYDSMHEESWFWWDDRVGWADYDSFRREDIADRLVRIKIEKSVILDKKMPIYRPALLGKSAIGGLAGGLGLALAAGITQGVARWQARIAVADSACLTPEHQVIVAGIPQCPHYGPNPDSNLTRTLGPSSAALAEQADNLQRVAIGIGIGAAIVTAAGATVLLLDRYLVKPRQERRVLGAGINGNMIYLGHKSLPSDVVVR